MTATVPERETGWIGLERLMTTDDVASVLRVSAKTVRDMRKRGELPGVEVASMWMFEPAAVRAYIASRRKKEAG